MTTRRLSLARETLTALTADELAGVAGAAAPTTPLRDCVATLSPDSLDVRDCVRISDAHTCIDCLTRWC